MIPRCMQYQLYQLKLEQLVSYFKDGVIDLAPPFQRGRVWSSKLRQGLLKNILQGRPVPAIFIYKKAAGSKNYYVILDGKQRLESILLYIGEQRADFQVPAWKSYFSRDKEKGLAHFKCQVNGELKNLNELSDAEVVKFRDYLLPIIEIDFDETATLGDMIQLFVDINQYGVKVERFDIVKALYLHDPLLTQIFNLLAMKRKRPHDVIYKIKNTAFCRVFKKLEIVNRVDGSMNRVDVMWEKLFELALFTQTGEHRKPVQILKEFISRRGAESTATITAKDVGLLTKVFAFIATTYRQTELGATRLATDQTHFYIFVTALINQLKKNGEILPDMPDKLLKFASLISGELLDDQPVKIQKKIKEYIGLSTKQTTDVTKRQRREQLFTEIINALFISS